ncbi:MAG: nucleoside hydrolase [Candidatus Aenigmarchaeota archaeon]|nr:nucleoside hydrolase [Candidatus Aenigmarchaeota archaeon]
MKMPLVISTDIGTDVDDAIAVYLASRDPGIDLKAVWVTNGDTDIRAGIASKLLRLCGSNAGVLKGEPNPLEPGLQPYTHGYEKDFLDSGCVNNFEGEGIAPVREILDENEGVVIASIAPMTNMARLLRDYPESQNKLKRVYIMGFRIGNNEHNAGHDPRAAREVLDSDLRLTIVPGELCDRYKMEASDLIYMAPETDALLFIGEMAHGWLLYNNIRALANIPKRLDSIPMLTVKSLAARPIIDALREKAGKYKNLKELDEFNFHLNALLTGYPEFSHVKEDVEKARIKTIAVHDAYTIFCMLHPEHTERVYATVTLDKNGVTHVGNGGRHEYIIGLDYGKFQDFLYSGLGIKPE